jgi:hypothetical protein
VLFTTPSIIGECDSEAAKARARHIWNIKPKRLQILTYVWRVNQHTCVLSVNRF